MDDGDNWAVGNSVELTKGNKVLWRGEMTPEKYSGVGTFSSTGQFEAQGNIMSLLFGNDFKGKTGLTDKNYAFFGLFSSNSNLVNAQNLSLPATTLANYCYNHMFYGCTGLETAPELSATTLAEYCYTSMFDGCTKLTTAPSELPATILAEGCSTSMFYGCTGLVNAPELPAPTLAYGCYQNMFRNCTNLKYIKCLATNISATYCLTDWVYNVASSGRFVKAASMESWTTGNSGIPTGWTVETATK